MSGYTNVFTGAQVVLPSSRSYSALALSENTTLVWPSEGNQADDQLTAILDVIPATAGLQVRLPPGDEASPGSACVFVNSGAQSFDLRVNDASLSVATVAAGVAMYVYLSDNSTTQGSWRSFTLGAGSVAPSLSSQTGAGLVYFNGLINAGYPTEDVATATYALTEGDRATAIVNVGGSLTVNLADLTTAFETNFFWIARNSGSGTMTLDPSGSQQIDSQSTITLNQGDSCFVILDAGSSMWRTIGRQNSSSSGGTVTSGIIDATGTGDLALSTADVGFAIQEFQGVLAGNRTVTYGSLTGVWYIFNNTTGAFTMTFRVDGSDAGVVIAQGERGIITLNGTNADLAFTTSGGGSVSSITFQSPLTNIVITGSGTVGMENSGVAGGTYGGTAGWPVFVVSTKGLISSATTLPGTAVAANYLPTTGGTGTGTYAFLGPISVASISGTTGTFSGALTAASFTGTSAVISGTGAFGVVNATSGAIGALTGTTANFSGGGTFGSLTASSAAVSGTGAFGVVSGTTGTFSGAVTGASFTGSNFAGTSANFSGTGTFGVVNATSAVLTSTGLAVNATAGTGAFLALSVSGSAVTPYIPTGTLADPISGEFPIGAGTFVVKAGLTGAMGSGATTNIVFGTAMPTAIVAAVAVTQGQAGTPAQPFAGCTNFSTTGFTIHTDGGGAAAPFSWIAIGF